ncbi:MAG: VOC family protein [Pirellulales bacterium]|nr:VOC family protein [Pirellulales bacterium]
MKIEPYLFFDGHCEEALRFYEQALGATVTMLMRFRENPDAPPGSIPPDAEDKIMHCVVKIGDSTVMASDGMNSGQPRFQGISLSLNFPTVADAQRAFQALEPGGQVQMPFGSTFFSPGFGMVADKFGVSWMILTDPPAA